MPSPKALALIQASLNGDLSRMRVLIDEGFLASACGPMVGRTALIRAMEGASSSAVEMLINAGASLEQVCERGSTPILWAAQLGNPDIFCLLANHGAHLHAKDRATGGGILHAAAAGGHASILRLALAQGLDPNMLDRDGASALFAAAASGSVDSAKALIEGGADAFETNSGRGTALWRACSRQGQVVAEFLATLGGPLDHSPDHSKGTTALHVCAQLGMDRACEALIMAGAPIDLLDARGHPPWTLAERDHPKLADWLKTAGLALAEHIALSKASAEALSGERPALRI